jgi:predicted metal-dependent hydrolase
MKPYLLQLENIEIQITQKRIRNIHLKISPPNGAVTVSAPLSISQEKIKIFIISKLDWIKKVQLKIRSQKRAPEPKYISGEDHYFFDKKFSLEVLEQKGRARVMIDEDKIILFIKKDFTLKEKKKLFEDFYRNNLKKIIPNYIKKWEEKMNLKVAEFGIKKMKTRWGTCNIKDRRIWINLELAKKPIACLEYIVVHEMVHLLEKNHTKKFFSYMDKFLPNWQNCKIILRSLH